MRRTLSALAATALVAPLLALAATPSTHATTAEAQAPAAKKAAVRSVITQTPSGPYRGRLSSSRSGCVRGKDVYLIFKSSDSRYPQIGYADTTDADGRWSTGLARTSRGGQDLRATAFTLGDRTCRIAQSRTLTSTPARRAGAKAAVSITLERLGMTRAGGRISSERASCGRFRPVFLFERPSGSDVPYDVQLASISRATGVWRLEEDGSMQPRRQGGDPEDNLAAVPGNATCRPAQSAVVRATPAR